MGAANGALVWLLGTAGAAGVALSAARAADSAIASAIYENDSVSPTDRDYTAGAAAAWVGPRSYRPEWAEWTARRILGADQEDDIRVGYGVKLQMFTPDDIEAPRPDPADRPFAGYASGSVALMTNHADRAFRSMSLDVGVIGPLSQADNIQRLAHDLTNSRTPRGWDAQITNRPGVNLHLSGRHIVPLIASTRGLGVDAVPSYGASLGNVSVAAEAGLLMRLGWRPPVDAAPARIAPNAAGTSYFRPTAPLGGYVFGGVSGKAIARDLFLDEPSAFGAKVEKKPVVADFLVGVAFNIRSVRVGYTHVWRTRQFSGQSVDRSRFGSLNVAVAF